MPLHDHFHPPWSLRRPWEGFHGAWATSIAYHLNRDVLPAEYYAMPLLQVGGQVEFKVQVHRDLDGPQLRAAIDLVSPLNKDRPSSRRAFAAKCAGDLGRGVSVIVIDIVTERAVDLHAEIMRGLGGAKAPPWESATGLYAASYRGVLATEPPRLEVWAAELTVGSPLPELPLWLEIDLSVRLALEESYSVTCDSLRMRG